jgi:large subunit ribosomal protein L15
MAHRERKTRKMRGSRMHGYGNTQKHRGAGSRGGHGMAGSKKQRWHYVSKYLPGYFGERGFKRHHDTQDEKDQTINVGYLSDHIKTLTAQGHAKEAKGAYTIDLAAAGYDKLLGAGKVTEKLNVKVTKCSESAKEKIEAAGGSVETTAEEKAKTGKGSKKGD